jgi:hypothetical protein
MKETKWKKEKANQNEPRKSLTGSTRAIHSYVIEKPNNTDCPFCNSKRTVEHIIWICKETDLDKIRTIITQRRMDQRTKRYAQTE